MQFYLYQNNTKRILVMGHQLSMKDEDETISIAVSHKDNLIIVHELRMKDKNPIVCRPESNMIYIFYFRSWRGEGLEHVF